MGGSGRRGAHSIENTARQYIPFAWVKAGNLAERGVARVGSQLLVDKGILLKFDSEVIFVDGGGLALVVLDYRKKPGCCTEACRLSISSPPTSTPPP